MTDSHENTTANDSTIKKPKSYRAFWHLEAIGVLEAKKDNSGSQTHYESGVWERLTGSPSARVALIDTGVSRHPYLFGPNKHESGQIDSNSVDITRIYDDQGQKKNRGSLSKINTQLLARLGLETQVERPDLQWLHAFTDELEKKFVPSTISWEPSLERFSGHGTSCAGLVVGRTPAGEPDKPPPMCYYGVDPFSQVLSIATGFAPEPETLVAAFLYAYAEDSHVILFPRGTSEMVAAAGEQDESCVPSPQWRALREVILAVSQKIPVVCAAGNDAESRMIAPANFAADAKQPNGIIAVGAASFLGLRSSYSSYGPGLTIVGPSDDAEMINENQCRLDPIDRDYKILPYEAVISDANIETFEFAEQSVLALDAPGDFGSSPTGDSVDEAYDADTPFFGYFTEFGGTSAASSIVAGVAALVQRASLLTTGAHLPGPEMRKLLVETALKSGEALMHSLHPQTGKALFLRPDKINGSADLSFEQAFGAGLVNAARAVEKLIPKSPARSE